MTPASDDREALRSGELEILGRIRSASNATFLCEATLGERRTHCVYKPIAGEQPLWDFPDGTLAGREFAAHLISVELGWNLVPYTIIRGGPAGPGMVQLWVDQPEDELASAPGLVDVVPVDRVPAGYLPVLQAYGHNGDPVALVHADDTRLRRIAVFDVVINNADRKGGHILCGTDGGVYGVDHGVSLHTQDKLRTVLWGWADKPVDEELLPALTRLSDAFGGPLTETLEPHLTCAEIDALRRRVEDLLEHPVMPGPNSHRPIPWPAF
ncbi:SCO1664 family protein [Mycolicibacter senuensis]|uniref:SCO1664 family protein n=1 Tax=Mycolicibacter senuensis TaxID=386913 RepID=UPI000A167954|nr:SCO1664 family protein [Mycolicibacter senuensis]ORW70810.1 phosphatidylinositol kinase [Mycolicibacter senuensis]